jgi:hypothetical protein
MTDHNAPGRWLIATALFLAFCSQGPSPSPAGPSSAPASVAALDDGRVGLSADGDVKVGTGALEIVRLRMDRQSPPGVSVLRQYADPGRTYAMNAGETIELWAEYPAQVANPRFRVEWGDGGIDATGCGSCLLTHRYPNPGTYTVKASLDDRVSTLVTRTFALEESKPGDGPSITSFTSFPLGPLAVGFGTNLIWTTTNAVSCSIDQGVGPVSCNGTRFVAPLAASTTYTLTATALGKTPASATTTVIVNVPVITFTASPSPITAGFGSILSWTPASGGTACSIDNGIGVVSCTGGTVSVSPLSSTTYTLTVTYFGTPLTMATATLVILPPAITSFTSDAAGPIVLGFGANLSWTTTNSANAVCSIDNGVGVVSCTGGPAFVTPTVTTTYTLSVSIGGTTFATATATVAVQ